MKEMKKDWEIYRDTGMLGAYRPELAILRETYTGDVITCFNDSEYWQDQNQFVQERDMIIGGKVFHVTSVFLDEDKATSTATDKLLSHIDMQMKKDTHGA